MKTRVHILATVRKPELLEAALLVFRTLRVGFPTSEIWVWGNRLDDQAAAVVDEAARLCGASFQNIEATVHDAWIEELIQEEPEPFWICDTDVVFWESMEAGTSELFAGRWEPGFQEESTGSLHVERLHTAVMHINPGPLRAAMRAWMAQIPAPWGHLAQFALVKQVFIARTRGQSVRPQTLFYDTMAGLWQAGMGTAFTREQDEAFDHLHCGTYVDAMAKVMPGLIQTHAAVYGDHRVAKGILEHQMKYYESRKE